MIYLYKFIGSFVQFPGILIAFFSLLTLYYFLKKRQIWRFFLILSIVFYLISSPFFVYFLSKSFYIKEKNIPDSQNSVIVILGGGITFFDGKYEVGNHTLKRLLKGFEIYRKTNAPIIISGGVIGKGISESAIIKEILVTLGININDIIVEDKARTTKENAIFVSKLLKEKNFENIILVTSFLHMKRSIMLFEKYSKKNIIPIVCDYPIDFRNSFLDYLPSAEALYTFSQITHEFFGILKGG
ncbi:YdcF family protein [Thermosipho sp. (in: thermotogales)]|uniref:YdcF family protein n=1 Tax=Thermosipho sp. (in: thermotogales) TaxID=1968895 RepID=UPI00257AD7F7|nr:YdcF family protein [Thermosipho sp. (in: thermotogales)]MBZ4650414.1 hypothetical protein [Thermosipho sp. (in: thermotogales)]